MKYNGQKYDQGFSALAEASDTIKSSWYDQYNEVIGSVVSKTGGKLIKDSYKESFNFLEDLVGLKE